MARPLIASHLLACGFRICRVQTRSVAPELCARLTSNRSRPRWRLRWFENNCFPAYEHVGRRVSDSFSAVWSGCFALVVVGHGLNGFRGDGDGFCDVRDARDRFQRVWRGLMNFFLFFRRNRNRDFINRRRKILHKSSIVVLCTFKIVSNGFFKLNSWSMCSIRNRIVNLIYFEIIGTGKLNSALKDIEILLIEKDDLF